MDEKSKGRSEEAALEPTARYRRVSKRILAPNRYLQTSDRTLAQALPGIQSGLKITHHHQDFFECRHITIEHLSLHAFVIGLPSRSVGLCG